MVPISIFETYEKSRQFSVISGPKRIVWWAPEIEKLKSCTQKLSHHTGGTIKSELKVKWTV